MIKQMFVYEKGFEEFAGRLHVTLENGWRVVSIGAVARGFVVTVFALIEKEVEDEREANGT